MTPFPLHGDSKPEAGRIRWLGFVGQMGEGEGRKVGNELACVIINQKRRGYHFLLS